MTNTDNKTLKIIILLQLIITITAYFLIRHFISPKSMELWWYPGTCTKNLLGGIFGAVILFIPIFIYIKLRSTQLYKGLAPLLPICHQPLLLLIILSILAGLGEELLFRAFIQEWLGIWWAAIIFLLPHLGLPLNLPRVQDRFFLTLFYLLAGLWLGLLAREIGLVAAIIAHSLYDISAICLIRINYTLEEI